MPPVNVLCYCPFRGTLKAIIKWSYTEGSGSCNKEFVIRNKNGAFASEKMMQMKTLSGTTHCSLWYLSWVVSTGWYHHRERHRGRSHGDFASTRPFWRGWCKLRSSSRTFAGRFLRNKATHWHTQNKYKLRGKYTINLARLTIFF